MSFGLDAVSVAELPLLFALPGARAAHAMDMKLLRRAFACVLHALAAYMLYKGLAG